MLVDGKIVTFGPDVTALPDDHRPFDVGAGPDAGTRPDRHRPFDGDARLDHAGYLLSMQVEGGLIQLDQVPGIHRVDPASIGPDRFQADIVDLGLKDLGEPVSARLDLFLETGRCPC